MKLFEISTPAVLTLSIQLGTRKMGNNMLPNPASLQINRKINFLYHNKFVFQFKFRTLPLFNFEDFHILTSAATRMSRYLWIAQKRFLANLIDFESKSLLPSNYDKTNRQIILVDIARGMKLFHNRCVVHRDLKPENILLDSDFRPRITDFSLSKFLTPSTPWPHQWQTSEQQYVWRQM